MEKQNYHTVVTVNATTEEATKKIGRVDGWWARDFTGRAASLHDKFSVHFGKTFVDFQITEFIPHQKIVWKVTDCNLHWINAKKEWNGTEVVFRLSEKGKSTQIDFTHVGLVPGAECYENCKEGWTGHVTMSLVKFINEGKGMPA